MRLFKNKKKKMNYTRTEQKALSFYGEQLLRGRHRIHPYPAMLHPLLVNYLIDGYAKKGDVIFDPFCGSRGDPSSIWGQRL